jgi:hypothetical protein
MGGDMTIAKINYAIAAAAVTSPMWLQATSGVFKDILPIVGVVLATFQLIKLYRDWNKK